MIHRKAGILGGTFDPVHLGHLALAKQAILHLNLDAVVFIPTYQPPHKEWAPYAGYKHRFRMLELAVAGDRKLTVNDIEQRRGGVSYTFDTVMELKQLEPNTDWYFISGSDAYAYFMTWHRWRDLLDLCKVVIAKRPRFDIELDDTLEKAARESRYGMRYITVDTPDISSTMIRTLLREPNGLDHVRDLMPKPVFDYIVAHRLYLEDSHVVRS